MSDPKGIGFETKYSTSQNVGPSTCHIKKKKKVLLFEIIHKVKARLATSIIYPQSGWATE